VNEFELQVWGGTLTEKDHEVVRRAMQTVGAAELAHRPVGELSDGELCADIFDSARRFAPSPGVIRGGSDQHPISAIDSSP
jgi:ABC-type cobalamin/Fe3+-siderophores transport system ATPase subunit